MALGSKGTVFVGTRQLKDGYAIVDRGGKREVRPSQRPRFAERGRVQQGHAQRRERHAFTRYDGIESRLDQPPEAKSWSDGLDPQKQPGHFWKFSRARARR